MAKVNCPEAGRRPPELPADRVMILGKKSGEGDGGGGAAEVSFPLEFPYDWVYLSELISSKVVEPAAGAAGEGCDGARAAAAGLSRRAAVDFLQQDEEADPAAAAAAATTTAGYSPMSTLSAAENWNSSCKEVSMLPSLSPTQLGDEEARLYGAAGKQRRQAGQAILSSPAGRFAENGADGYYGYHRQHRDAIAHIQQLKRQQLAELAACRRRNREPPKEGGGGGGGSRPARPPAGPPKGASWARHPLQAGAGMRAVFLGAVSGRESGGTGVFLPRQNENPADGRKKPGLSTALLPVRVMQALNLNLDDFAAGPRSPGGSLLPQDAINARTIALMSQARSSGAPPAHAARRRQPELCLPAEWTY